MIQSLAAELHGFIRFIRSSPRLNQAASCAASLGVSPVKVNRHSGTTLR